MEGEYIKRESPGRLARIKEFLVGNAGKIIAAVTAISAVYTALTGNYIPLEASLAAGMTYASYRGAEQAVREGGYIGKGHKWY